MPSTSRTFDITQIVNEKYEQQQQTIDFSKQQIVVIDDGSTDSTVLKAAPSS